MSAPVLTVRIDEEGGDDNAPESREVVEQTGFDRWSYSSAREVVEELVATETAFSEKGWDGEAVTADLHASLWKAEPTIRDGASAAHRALIEETMRTTERTSFEGAPPETTFTERLAAFDAKWRPKIAHTLPPDASVGYMAWCLLYVTMGGVSPHLTASELAEAASDFLKLNGAVDSQVESQARRVIALLRY